MGVTGLWKLLEPCGKPVPLESLENQVLAVDVSIWLNQAMKGYRDGQNGTLQNAHLLGVFHRACKLLTYKIKPVFVFDGGVPSLKRDTLAARRLKKQSASQAADKNSQKLVQNLLQQEALRAVLGERAPLPLAVATSARPDPMQLPLLPPSPPVVKEETDSSSDDEADMIVDRLGRDMHSFDFDSEEFRNLAPQVKHDILSELKETRKQSSWGKLDQMPKESDNFADFQMERLLKRKKFQASMDEVEAEITKRNTELLHMGIDLPGTMTSQHMASRSDTLLVLGRLGAAPEPQPALKQEPEPEPEPESEPDDAALLEAADTAEYLAGADLFGGGGGGGAGSAARVDRQLEERLAARRRAVDGKRPPAGAAGQDTAETFSEMGKKFSNLYLQFSAQWLKDEKASKSGTQTSEPPGSSVKTESVRKRQAPQAVEKSTSVGKDAAKRPKLNGTPTLREITKDLAKLSPKKGKSSLSTSSARSPTGSGSRPTAEASSGAGAEGGRRPPAGGLQISIAPLSGPGPDDLFRDVFAADGAAGAAEAAGGADEVLLMSDSSDSAEDEPPAPAEPGSSAAPARPAADGAAPSRPGREVHGSGPGAGSSPAADRSGPSPAESSETPARRRQSLLESAETPGDSRLGQDAASGGRRTSQTAGESREIPETTLGEQRAPAKGADNQTAPEVSDERGECGKVPDERESPGVVSNDQKSPKGAREGSAASEKVISDRKALEAPIDSQGTRRDDGSVQDAPDVPAAAADGPGEDDLPWEEVGDEELRDMADELASRQLALLEERGRQQRLAATVTDDMYAEVQTLLQLFGIPYVVSPEEAEAQCAYLEVSHLTQGSITDDSDVWLFGGRRVYKNFFNQNKFVERYQLGDIQGSLGLDREKLVCLALLTGSDYTCGVETVGCVRALEILAEFPGSGLDGLRCFKLWWDRCRAGAAAAAARTPIRRSLATLQLSEGFPSEAVMSAYLEPKVDTSKEPFSWAEPDLDGLRDFAAIKFGWSPGHTDSMLMPMIKGLRERQGQRRLDSYFITSFSQQTPADASDRLQRAIGRVKGEPEPAQAAPAPPAAPPPADYQALLEDDEDVLLAALDDPDAVDGADPHDLDGADPDDPTAPEPAPVSGAAGGGAPRGRRAGRAVAGGVARRVRKPAAACRRRPPRPRGNAAAPTSPSGGSPPRPRVRRSSAGPPGESSSRAEVSSVPAWPPGEPPRSGVPSTPAASAELAELEPAARERVLLVRRLRERASLVRSELRLEAPAGRPPRRPTTREVRAQMLDALVRNNPRLRVERDAQLRRRLGLPVAASSLSCRDAAGQRQRSFEQALAGAGDAPPRPAADRADGPGGAGDPGDSGTGSAEDEAAAAEPPPRTPESSAGELPPETRAPGPSGAAGPSPPTSARSGPAGPLPWTEERPSDRFRLLPRPPAPSAGEVVPQRQLSEQRQAEARRQAAALLRSTGARRRRQRPAAGRPRARAPLPAERQAALSESSDSS